jgi:hypothetical protein
MTVTVTTADLQSIMAGRPPSRQRALSRVHSPTRWRRRYSELHADVRGSKCQRMFAVELKAGCDDGAAFPDWRRSLGSRVSRPARCHVCVSSATTPSYARRRSQQTSCRSVYDGALRAGFVGRSTTPWRRGTQSACFGAARMFWRVMPKVEREHWRAMRDGMQAGGA